MRYKIATLLIGLLVSVNAFALLRFPKGTLVLQGKILVHQKKTYLVVNYKSNSETRIELKGHLPKDIHSQGGSNASIKLKIAKSFMSAWGEAEFVELRKYLNPFETPMSYNDERLLPKE